jgi:poly(ADP-ribose) glycohydrolase
LNLNKKPISTGRWGCGVFKGDSQLKFLIQLMAASRAGKEMKFFSFGDEKLRKAGKVYEKYKGKSVGEVMGDVVAYCENHDLMVINKTDLFAYILS